MSDNDVGSYETLKENLLKRFTLTEGRYRKRFKQSKMENGETPEQFIARLRRYLQKWHHMAGFEQTYEGLEDLILRDQFFITCDKPLQTFLKEKGKMTLKKMSQVAANYINAHGNTTSTHHNAVSKKGQSSNKRSNDRADFNSKQVNFGPCSHCELRNHKTEDCRHKPQQNKTHKASDITRFNCNAMGHRKRECSSLGQGGMHKAAAMQLLLHNHPQVYKIESPCKENESTCREVELSCGCKMPTVAGAMSPEGQHMLEHWRTQETPCCVGRVNGVQVIALLDTGSMTCVVKTELMSPEQMTGSYELCILIDGVVKQFPTATEEIDTPFYKGHVKALCMDNLVQEVIIGNITGALGLRQHSSDRTEVMVRCDDTDKIISGSQDHTTTAVGTKEMCDRSQCQCDTRPTRSSDHTTADVETTEVKERPLDQSDELEKITQSRIKGGAPCPLGGRIDYV